MTSRAHNALMIQANLQTLRESAYDTQVAFCNGHATPPDARPQILAAFKAPARAAIYEAAQRVTAALDDALDAQVDLAARLREYAART